MTAKVTSLSPGRGTLTYKWVPKPKASVVYIRFTCPKNKWVFGGPPFFPANRCCLNLSKSSHWLEKSWLSKRPLFSTFILGLYVPVFLWYTIRLWAVCNAVSDFADPGLEFQTSHWGTRVPHGHRGGTVKTKN